MQKETQMPRIVDDILKGDLDKYELIMHKYQRAIFQYCYHMLGQYTEAEDCGQEVFLKAYQNLAQYRQDMPFEAWLYKIANNQCIDLLRKRRLARYLPFLYRKDQENSPIDQRIEAKYFNTTVIRTLSRLTPEERSLLILRSVEDKSYREISLILHKNSTSLRKKFERSAAKFRKYYALEKGEEPFDPKQRSGVQKINSTGSTAGSRPHRTGHEQTSYRI